MTDPVTLIAERLPHGIPHPGNPEANQKPFTVVLPGMRSTGIPNEQAELYAAAAGLPHTNTPKLLAEALVNLLQTDGDMTIIANSELAELRQAAADAPDGTRIIKVKDRGQVLFELTIGKTDETTIDRRLLARALGQVA